MPTSSRYVLTLVFAAALPLLGCDPSSSPAGDGIAETVRLVATGSSTLAPLVSDVVRRYESEHPGVRIDVQTGGSSRGLADVRRGLADLGMVSRSPREGEDDVVWHPVALDGLAIIVHTDNPLEAVTEEQVVAIYRGEIESWKELGDESFQRDAPITVVHKAEGRSTLEVFLAYFGLENPEVQADVVIGENQQAIKTVVGNPGAIAYVSIGTAEVEAANGAPLRLLRLGTAPSEAEPSTDALRAGAYPVARTLHVVTSGEPKDAAADFLRYLRSSAVHDLVESHFFVPMVGNDLAGNDPSENESDA